MKQIDWPTVAGIVVLGEIATVAMLTLHGAAATIVAGIAGSIGGWLAHKAYAGASPPAAGSGGA